MSIEKNVSTLSIDLRIGDITKIRIPGNSASKESTSNAGDPDLILGLGRSPGEGKGYPLQYSGLENSTRCIVHRVAKSRMLLSDFHFHLYFSVVLYG